jgi:hypothetical protein
MHKVLPKEPKHRHRLVHIASKSLDPDEGRGRLDDNDWLEWNNQVHHKLVDPLEEDNFLVGIEKGR